MAAARSSSGAVPLAAPQALPPRGRRLPARFRGPVLREDGLPAPTQGLSGLDTTITVRQLDDAEFDLDFDVDGPATSLTIELCFRSGGELTGVDPDPAGGVDNFQLVSGEGSYTVGTDTITFGPGNGSGLKQPIAMDPGEKYTYLGGSLVPAGLRVYITGEVPFRYTLSLR